MAYCDDLCAVGSLPKHNQKREFPECCATSPKFVWRESMGTLFDLLDCTIEFVEEHLGGSSTALAVPECSGFGFLQGSRVDPN